MEKVVHASTKVFFDGLQGASNAAIHHVLVSLALFSNKFSETLSNLLTSRQGRSAVKPGSL
jgi:hypothetical protein